MSKPDVQLLFDGTYAGGYHDDMVSTALGLLVDKIGSRPDLWGHVETDVARRT